MIGGMWMVLGFAQCASNAKALTTEHDERQQKQSEP